MNSPKTTPSASPRLATTSPTHSRSPSLSPIASPRSRASSRASHLTLDLSNLPPLSAPATPTNTLLLTNLHNASTFTPSNLAALRHTISAHAAPTSFSPLKSFRRVVCTFASAADALKVRQALDGSCVLGDRVRVYFGEHTPAAPEHPHLELPEAKKLFFISPPPSPPAGWEVREEEAPNGVVLAEDLAEALARLREKGGAADENAGMKGERREGRGRSGSCVVLLEEEAGRPGVSVDDYEDAEQVVTPGRVAGFERTSRPPVELMSS